MRRLYAQYTNLQILLSRSYAQVRTIKFDNMEPASESVQCSKTGNTSSCSLHVPFLSLEFKATDVFGYFSRKKGVSQIEVITARL